jgi:hypothetical protein
VTETINTHIEPDGVRFEHPECGFEVKVSYAEFRRLGAVACPNCRVVLMTHEEMLESMEGGLAKAATNPNPQERAVAEKALRDTRRRLLG